MLFIVYADYLEIMHEKIEMEALHLAESLDNIKTVSFESHGNAWQLGPENGKTKCESVSMHFQYKRS